MPSSKCSERCIFSARKRLEKEQVKQTSKKNTSEFDFNRFQLIVDIACVLQKFQRLKSDNPMGNRTRMRKKNRPMGTPMKINSG